MALVKTFTLPIDHAQTQDMAVLRVRFGNRAYAAYLLMLQECLLQPNFKICLQKPNVLDELLIDVQMEENEFNKLLCHLAVNDLIDHEMWLIRQEVFVTEVRRQWGFLLEQAVTADFSALNRKD